MLIPTKTGFIEIVKEPQFNEILTIQATDLDSVRLFRQHTQARMIFNDYSKTFRFFTYAYASDISSALNMKFREKDIEELDKNISPAPVGYRCLGFWHDRDEDVQLDVLAEELEAFKEGHDLSFDEFFVWPLFHMTDELIEQKNRAA
jgi:hypothetical protein